MFDCGPLGASRHRHSRARRSASTSIEVSSAPQFASEIAELFGGNPLRASSSGGAENLARFDIVGRKNGSFLISIRLVPSLGVPRGVLRRNPGTGIKRLS